MSQPSLEEQQQEFDEKEDYLADVFAEYLERYETDAEATSIDIRHLPEMFKDMGIYGYYYSDVVEGPVKKERQRALREIVNVLDPRDQGRIDFMAFCEVMPMVLEQAHGGGEGFAGRDGVSGKKRKRAHLQKEEMEESFYLFTNGEDRAIGLKDLRRIAEEVGDGKVSDDDLRDMLRLHAVEKSGGSKGVEGVNEEDLQVSKEDFFKIMEECDM